MKFDVGTLVYRNPEMEEYLYPHELEEVGIVVGVEQDGWYKDVIYVIVLWGNNLSWETPGDLLGIS